MSGVRLTPRERELRLSKRQRELLVEMVERGSVDWPNGARGRPLHALKDHGLGRLGQRGGGYTARTDVMVPTDAGRELAPKIAAGAR